MNGIINIFKPPGLTSHDVVSRVRKKLGIKRVGHTGTLDPMATGVLPICVGSGTKIVQYLMSDEKKYRFEITFGYETDTLDGWGKITLQKEWTTICRGALETVLSEMVGEQLQIPPQYSALRVNGQRAYDLARRDEHVELAARPITIQSMTLLKYENKQALIDVVCSKGTYVRSIVRDIARRFDQYGTMTFLQRLSTGPFHYLNAVPIQLFMDVEDPEHFIQPIDSALPFPKLHLDGDSTFVFKLQNGVPMALNAYDLTIPEGKRLVYLKTELFGLADYVDDHLKIIKRF